MPNMDGTVLWFMGALLTSALIMHGFLWPGGGLGFRWALHKSLGRRGDSRDWRVSLVKSGRHSEGRLLLLRTTMLLTRLSRVKLVPQCSGIEIGGGIGSVCSLTRLEADVCTVMTGVDRPLCRNGHSAVYSWRWPRKHPRVHCLSKLETKSGQVPCIIDHLDCYSVGDASALAIEGMSTSWEVNYRIAEL
uniref:Secreted protein n=1 Tax=Panagrellus redivivus TaxID=6233 RepID=A0A7E4V9R3_PANRE